MQCSACGGRVTSDGTALQSGRETGQTAVEATLRCPRCGRYPADPLLRMLTRLANCGLTAASPAILEASGPVVD
jgi:hypothetical protein